ncbi:4-carboxy-4-hydroxy-2-oxoadipate aldolase/oxaloacetate decarboxylase [Virgisporangium aurantiacum]
MRLVDRAAEETIDALRGAGVATAHEAAGRVGLLGPEIRPRQTGTAIGGSAITVSCHPGDNLMIHAAVEVCRPGDVLVVTTTSPSTDGMFGELLATSLIARGVVGLVIDAGVRDIADLRDLSFPVWSRSVHAQGTVKASPGSVNVPVVVAGRLVSPGDNVVLALPAAWGPAVAAASAERLATEATKRAKLAGGTLGVDLYNLRPLLADLGVRYVDRLPENGSTTGNGTA